MRNLSETMLNRTLELNNITKNKVANLSKTFFNCQQHLGKARPAELKRMANSHGKYRASEGEALRALHRCISSLKIAKVSKSYNCNQKILDPEAQLHCLPAEQV